MSDKTFDALETLAVAVACYEINQGYVKATEYEHLAQGHDGANSRYANKTLLRAYYDLDYYSVDSPRPPLVKVTEQHRMIAEDIRNYSKKEIFKVLSKKPAEEVSVFGLNVLMNTGPEYGEKLYQLINQETVNDYDFGYVASAPHYYEIGKSRDYRKRVLDTLDSKWVGSVGGRVFLENFEVLRCTKSKNFEGYVVQGTSDGNLFLYFTSKNCSHLRTGHKIKIQGKIKEHVMESDIIPMTKLNYVIEKVDTCEVNNTNLL